jgi:xylose isomerase
MDAFARAFMTAHEILDKSAYLNLRKNRYASFDSGDGQKFEKGMFRLEDLRELAIAHGEPEQLSGKQELYESILNQYI